MRIKNNKGFTLVELIIAMSILTIVLGIGYNVLIKSSSATKDQTEVFNEQQAATIVNKYLTKDLEQCRIIEKIENESTPNIYSYIINENTSPVEYVVVRDIDNSSYDVTRKDGKSSVEIVSNQYTNNDRPFSIDYKYELGNVLIVKLNGKSRNGEFIKYKFEVTSRVTDNIITLGWTTPDIEDSDSNNGESSGGNDDNSGDNSNGESSGGNDDNSENNSNEVPNTITGVIEFEYNRKNHKDNYLNLVGKCLLDSSLNLSYPTNINKPIQVNTSGTNFKITAEIPIFKNDQLKVHMQPSSGDSIGSKIAVFGGTWPLFKQSLLTEGIKIDIPKYEGIETKIDVSIGGKPLKKLGEEHHYIVDFNQISKSDLENVIANVTIDITIPNGKDKDGDFLEKGKINIIFGRLNIFE